MKKTITKTDAAELRASITWAEKLETYLNRRILERLKGEITAEELRLSIEWAKTTVNMTTRPSRLPDVRK